MANLSYEDKKAIDRYLEVYGGNISGGVTTPYIISADDQSIYADSAKGVKDPNGIEGWHYTSSGDLTEKINWYYLNNAGVETNQTLTTLQGGYAVITLYATGVCYFNVYTKRKNDGQDNSWFRSRVTYLSYNSLDDYVNQRILIYWGEEPSVYPELPRVEMTYDPLSSVGVQELDEEVFLSALNTSSNAPQGLYSFTAQSLGYIDSGVYHNFPCTAHTDVTSLSNSFSSLSTNVTSLTNFLNAVNLGRFFRGYVMDEAEMVALTSPLIYQYVVRVDTETIWEFNGSTWVDTLITASLIGIGTQDQQLAGYSNTHYINLDGTNDYLDLDTGVNANVLDYTQSWALGFEVESVSGVEDSTYTTLWKRGENEITLRKGGSNWGVYFYANGNSVGQANTWRRPEIGSKVLFVCNGTQVKYYLYRPSNGEVYQATMTLNQTNVTNHNNATGNLQLGQMGVQGSNWFGGINNALIMEGSGSDLGANQITEYFGGQDVTLMSFYNDAELIDFLPLGEDIYPTVTGTKGVVSGNLINGTESDFVAR